MKNEQSKSESPVRNAEQAEAWIVEHYGPIEVAEAHGVHLAVVPILHGRAIGLGSSRFAALLDLREDLHGVRETLPRQRVK